MPIFRIVPEGDKFRVVGGDDEEHGEFKTKKAAMKKILGMGKKPLEKVVEKVEKVVEKVTKKKKEE